MDAVNSRWPRIAIGVHLLVVAVASWQLAGAHAAMLHAGWALASGVSLFVLTGLIHEASHSLLARSIWLNELAGNLAGWLVLAPLTAYRAFHLKHHQSTNRDGDPNAPLNSRWMLLFGAALYTALIHFHAWRNLRGRRLLRYLLEMVGMLALCAALALLLPRALRERAWLLPLGVVVLLQNIRIVSEHLDLPSGRYHDTWQLVLPGWLSRWLLHYDHHLEHHLRPGLEWHQLPRYRAELIAREPSLPLRRVTIFQYAREVLLNRPAGSIGVSPAGRSAKEKFENWSARGQRSDHSRLRADDAKPAVDSQQSPGPRYHGLDALRSATMILVVVLHAALAYAVIPIPNLIWVAHDPARSLAFDLLCWWTLGISSPFYLMSGFFAAGLIESRGLLAFLVNRANRIVGPFLAAGLIVLPATFFVWVAGWLATGECTPREFLRMKFHAPGYQRNLYGPAHLWSLEYLAVMLGAFWIVMGLRRHVRGRSPGTRKGPGWLVRPLASRWRPLLLALPSTLILWAGHRQLGLDAMMDRMNSFVPEPWRLLHNTVFFVVGVYLHRLRQGLDRFADHRWFYLALSVPVFAVRALLIERDLTQHLDGPAALALAASGALFSWLITFGLLGLALGYFDRPWPALRYFADSSYWVYLCHLPIVGLLQVDLLALNAPAAVKFLIVLGGTLTLCLASYQVVVRHTLLGAWLHGRRDRRHLATSGAPHFRTQRRTPRATSELARNSRGLAGP
jgi:fatty acid desaturase/peptidoglycan/LPS O-acetylase OafA/YrhL